MGPSSNYFQPSSSWVAMFAYDENTFFHNLVRNSGRLLQIFFLGFYVSAELKFTLPLL